MGAAKLFAFKDGANAVDDGKDATRSSAASKHL